MADVRIGIFVFALLAGAALLALWLHPRLPSHHLSKETTDIVRLGVGVVATITALALGLLISSVASQPRCAGIRDAAHPDRPRSALVRSGRGARPCSATSVHGAGSSRDLADGKG